MLAFLQRWLVLPVVLRMHYLLAWVLCFSTCAWASVQAGQPVIEVVPDPPVRFNDEAKASKYIVGLDKDGDAARLSAGEGERMVKMTDGLGRTFDCKLPSAPANATGSSAEQSSEGDGSARSPTELLDSMVGLCFYRAEDWWTYELCFRKGVRQFHKDAPQHGVASDAGLIQFSLGQYSPDQSDTDRIQMDSSSTQRDVRYVSQMYTGGEPCDITGARRETEVRYVCGEGRSDVVASIKEPSTCHYVMTVQTSRLCNHPGFNVFKPQVAHILCRISDSDAEESAREPGSELAQGPGPPNENSATSAGEGTIEPAGSAAQVFSDQGVAAEHDEL